MASLPMTSTDELVALAKAAKPEIEGNWWDEDGLEELERFVDGNLLATCFEPAEVKFIAACSPDRIIDLARRVRELEAALKPFAAISDRSHCNDGLYLADADIGALACGLNIPVRSIRNARAALTKENSNG